MQMYSVAEVARALGVAERTVHGWIERGVLHAVRVGRRVWTVPESEVQRLQRSPLPRAGRPPLPREPLPKRSPGRPKKILENLAESR